MTDRNADGDADSDADANATADDEVRTGVSVVRTDEEREDAFAVRFDVFVDEQGVDEELEWDEHDEPDAEATHLVAYDDGVVVGAARVRPYDEETAKIERVVVAEDRRGEGWGERVMNAAEDEAYAAGFSRVKLHAQVRVREFYGSLGYRAVGEEFEDAGIPHVEMQKSLD
ncbi:GNAT family N-acetyltransferase [Halogeometricum sp. S1BR25-6]|uniref:GNAT family N-acetyltransferase n=1 Tax=Halogeometricum salsisoli TaxID=2950536 RepID=A0ABU2GFI9_9EURY|nr:GNAT family N-acetyltransferase [Halogeometricum sp. S1BR25-6]MDS0299104.1 GNAT family N-acetyltransferase [Halogeometricum sp. S1BR25-6]